MRSEQIEKPASAVEVWLPFAALGLFGAPLLLWLPVGHDQIWQIWLGRQMLGGAELYRDIIEVNPPLWFWIGKPLAAFGGDPRLTVVSFFLAATALSLFLIPQRFRLAALAVFLTITIHDFGQREHFTLLASAPYAFAIAARARGETPKHPWIIGLFAAVGLCLKPHFLLMPVALELLIWRRPHVRPECIAIVAFTAAYALAIALFAPAYFGITLPIVIEFYRPFGEAHPNYLMLGAAYLLAAAGALAGKRRGSVEARALLLASLAFIPAVLIQNKGFPYHSLPARGLLALACLVELQRARKSPWADGLLAGSVIVCAFPLGAYHNYWATETDSHLAGMRPGSSIIVMASNPSAAWPMIEQHGLKWGLHEMSPWQVNALVEHPELIADARRIVAPDFAKRPDYLIMDQRPRLSEAAYAMLPPDYLNCYAPRLMTPRLQSYRRIC